MAFALSSAKVFPLETEASFRSTFPHIAIIGLTAANTDTALNLATLAAADTTYGPYITELLNKADKLLGYFFLESQRSSGAVVKALDSSASAGGAATETLTVTGLLTTDTILGATIVEDGANSVYIREAAKTCAVNGQYVMTFSGDPGAGLELRVLVLREGGAANGTDHVLSGTAAAPVFTFAGGGDTPTALTLCLLVNIKKDYGPVRSTNV